MKKSSAKYLLYSVCPPEAQHSINTIESIQGAWFHTCMHIMVESPLFTAVVLCFLVATFVGLLCCGLVNFIV